MKFNVTSGELVNSLSAVIGAVPSKATLPILETVLFETEENRIRLSASDLEVSIMEYVEADVEAQGAIAVPARRLLETLRQLITDADRCRRLGDRARTRVVADFSDEHLIERTMQCYRQLVTHS